MRETLEVTGEAGEMPFFDDALAAALGSRPSENAPCLTDYQDQLNRSAILLDHLVTDEAKNVVLAGLNNLVAGMNAVTMEVILLAGKRLNVAFNAAGQIVPANRQLPAPVAAPEVTPAAPTEGNVIRGPWATPKPDTEEPRPC